MSKINTFVTYWYIFVLRREITQYCREPPSDFNEHQKSLFCVFSGHGVNQLRNYLNQVVEERTYQIDQGDIHTLFNERRRRFLNGDIDMNEEEMNIWERRRGLGVTADLGHPDMAEINREIFRELNEGNMGPDEMREHFQRLIRNHHQQRLLEHQNRLNQQLVQQRQQQQQQEPQLEQENLQNRGQIETQAPDQLPNEGQLRLQPPLQQQRAQNTIINNPQNAPQIEQPAVFPNGENQTLPLVLNEDEDVDMELVDLFPRNT